VRIGALGDISFPAGWYIYIGSALGSGGLARLDRHIAFPAAPGKNPKWHVDYLLRDPGFSLRYAVYAVTPDRLECRLAGECGGTGVPGFGCSDCSCTSHLFFRDHDPRDELVAAFGRLGLAPAIKTIIRQQRDRSRS